MSGPCAKRRTQAVLIAADGTMFLGENSCLEPQTACPRAPGEGYEKCKTVCDQPRHAELDVLMKAGSKAKGSRVIVSHTHACSECLFAMVQAEVKTIEFVGMPYVS